MLPIQLKLSNLRHCYIQLPRISNDVEAGSIISISSIQTDKEIFLIWNGQYTSADHAELDFNFSKANGFKDELVIINLKPNIKPSECSSCRVKLINNDDYNIVSQHTDINLLDTCKLISKGLIISLWPSQNVSILVEVTNIEPYDTHAFLMQSTEMQFEHSIVSQDLVNKELKKTSSENTDEPTVINIDRPIPIISCSLGYNYKPKFYLGSLLILGQRGSGKTHLLKDIINSRYKDYKSKLFNCKQFRGKRPDNIKKIFSELLAEAINFQPYILALDDIDAIVSKVEDEKGQEVIYKRRLVDLFCSMLKFLERNEETRRKNVMIIASARSLDSLDDKISKAKGRRYFNEVIKIGLPDQLERESVLKNIIREHDRIKSSLSEQEYADIAKRCTNYMPLDLRQLVERAIINTCSRCLSEFSSEALTLKHEDLFQSIDGYTPASLRGVSLKTKSGKTFDDVGGMAYVKEVLSKTILLQIKYPKLFKRCPMRTQSAVLLYGPPGCGKTLIAEALTNQENLNSICVRGPELLSKYIGASEGAVRDLFARAELARPCVIFFDEFESLVARRGADSTGVTDRIVNQFLTLMDGVDQLSSDVFIVAASSRPDMIDPAILRPGRIDKHICCPMPDSGDKFEILKVLSRNLQLESSIDLMEWSAILDYFTGADIESLLYSAQLKALHDIIDKRDRVKKDDESLGDIIIKQDHLRASLEEMRDSVRERHEKNESVYQKNFMNANQQRVATRATLV